MSSSSKSDATVLAAKFANDHVADVVEALNGLEPALGAEVLGKLPVERAAHILGQPGFDQPQRLVERLPIESAAAILAAMLADRRADIFRRLAEPLRSAFAPGSTSRCAGRCWSCWPIRPSTAGAIMTTEFVSVDADWTVGAEPWSISARSGPAARRSTRSTSWIREAGSSCARCRCAS